MSATASTTSSTDKASPGKGSADKGSADKAAAKPAAAAGPTSKWVWVMRLVVAALVTAVLGYLGGRIQGALVAAELESAAATAAEEHEAALAAAATEHEEALAAARAETDEAQARAARLTTAAAVYEAYRIAMHALDALDERNFGIAESQVREVERSLQPIADQVDGVAELLIAVAAIEVEVAADLAVQREALAAVIRRLDGLVSATRTSAGL